MQNDQVGRVRVPKTSFSLVFFSIILTTGFILYTLVRTVIIWSNCDLNSDVLYWVEPFSKTAHPSCRIGWQKVPMSSLLLLLPCSFPHCMKSFAYVDAPRSFSARRPKSVQFGPFETIEKRTSRFELPHLFRLFFSFCCSLPSPQTHSLLPTTRQRMCILWACLLKQGGTPT